MILSVLVFSPQCGADCNLIQVGPEEHICMVPGAWYLWLCGPYNSSGSSGQALGGLLCSSGMARRADRAPRAGPRGPEARRPGGHAGPALLIRGPPRRIYHLRIYSSTPEGVEDWTLRTRSETLRTSPIAERLRRNIP